MKAKTKVQVTMGFYKGKVGVVAAKPRGQKTIEEGKVFVRLEGETEVITMRQSILKEL